MLVVPDRLPEAAETMMVAFEPVITLPPLSTTCTTGCVARRSPAPSPTGCTDICRRVAGPTVGVTDCTAGVRPGDS